MKKFGMTGIAGYIAPRHLKAIKDTGNILVAAADPHDSVGIIDQFFPDASFFTEIERFDRHLDKLRNNSDGIDYLSICSPNYLHDAHIRLALRNGAHAICEKPLVLNSWNLDLLEKLEHEYDRRIYTVLQLRLHPSLVKIKEKLEKENLVNEKKHNVELTYITPRGAWYNYSWKGNVQKSGGLVTNIGIHLFDLMIWFFGKPVNVTVNEKSLLKVSGELELENAFVKWKLSVDKNDLPAEVIKAGKTAFRLVKFDEDEIEFSEGFTDLHTKIYEQVLTGDGFGIKDVRDSIELVQKIREM